MIYIVKIFKVSLFIMVFFLHVNVIAQEKTKIVRIAKLIIDSVYLEKYKLALKEHAEAAVIKEVGVLTLYAVYEKNNPTHVTVFEIYADTNAYNLHLKTEHFLKYKTETKIMVKALELVETVPIVLQSKH